MNPADDWLDRHADALFRYARLRVRDDSIAEDLVQETFLAGLRGREKFNAQSSEQTWLISILRNKIVDHYRATQKKPAIREADIPSDNEFFSETRQWHVRPPEWSNTPPSTLESAEFRATLYACIEKLPSPCREIFCLRELDQVSTEKICKMFEITPTNLWTMIHRAKLQLRKCLQKNWFDGPGPHVP